ncbi:MAG: tRNA (adenosine(37)-N6)-threonylcarbamoyltransferase complex ATPase subunit type 1 TsaE [Clostridiales bacterium]|nr:tRNA (adenosine(37)-N6)-threonylcarbamoyltransferase complex ATPase subunit type 1 TsaE [Clostridiales bacterium]
MKSSDLPIPTDKSPLVRYESHSQEDTARIGETLAASARPGDIFCLTGGLGAGKTVFTKGFARGLGIVSLVTSPTFTLVNEYQGGRLPLYHFDVYRLKNAGELYETGFEEYFYGHPTNQRGGVCVIEWAETVSELLPESNVTWVVFKQDFSQDPSQSCFREITVGPELPPKRGGLHEDTCD